MQEYRCKQCGTLLAKEDIRDGEIEIKCPRCNTFNRFVIETVDKMKKSVYSN